jgi:hypothetical protein
LAHLAGAFIRTSPDGKRRVRPLVVLRFGLTLEWHR